MGWLIALVLALMTGAGLWSSGRMTRSALELVLVALLIGLCGYAWQGSPEAAEVPAVTQAD